MFDPGKGSDCEEVEVHPKDIPKKLKQVPTETMHLMTVSCGRPNYQVKLKNLEPAFFDGKLESRKLFKKRAHQGFIN